MYIKSVEIDGFKSYAKLQKLEHFDREFNAVTGLNGSGKSNILDSICFLLGITNLSSIRADKMDDLVYKSGQAGIQKATVTVVFDNSDKKGSPIGCQSMKEIIVRRTIVVGGRHTYTLNGTAVSNAKVSDLFRSVGLNVNNPHFLIMQGRITKVLNMKPKEILGMIEEAAGTKMYDTKRQHAMNVIEKKEAKVVEINRLMGDEIIPQVEKLQEDRENYREYQRCDTLIATAKRRQAAFHFHQGQLNADECDADAVKIQQVVQEIEEKIIATQKEIDDLKEKMNKLEEKDFSSILAENNKVADSLRSSTEDRKCDVVDRKKELDEALAHINRLNKSIQNDKKEKEKKEAELARLAGADSEDAQGLAAETKVKQSRLALENLAKGLTTNTDGSAATLETKIQEVRTKLNQAQATVKATEVRSQYLEPTLKTKKSELVRVKGNNESEKAEFARLSKELARLEKARAAIDYESGSFEEVVKGMKEVSNRLREIEGHLNAIDNRSNSLQLKYTEPWQSFDHRNEIFGTVVTLFRVKNKEHRMAILTACGGQLFKVVCAKQTTAKIMVEKEGVLTRRTYFIPLDNCRTGIDKSMSDRYEYAKQEAALQGSTVFSALDLIEFDSKFQRVMEHVFGGILVTPEPTLAPRLALENPKVRLRTVTLDGEDWKPGGELTGGRSTFHDSILDDAKDLAQLTEQKYTLQDKMKVLQQEAARLEPLQHRTSALDADIATTKSRLEGVNDRLKTSITTMLEQEIAQHEIELTEAEEVKKRENEALKVLHEELVALEAQKKDEKSFIEKEKKRLQKELAENEKFLKDHKQTIDAAKRQVNSLREVVEQLRQSIERDEKEVNSFPEQRAEIDERIAAADAAYQKAKDEMNAAMEQMKESKNLEREREIEVKRLQAQTDNTLKTMHKLEGQKSTKENEATKLKNDAEGYRNLVASELKNNPWIEDEKVHFGKKGTDYDFSSYSSEKGKKQIEELVEKKTNLEKNLNTKAMHILQSAEERVMELKRKKEQIEDDKKRLLETFHTLDKKKKSEIIKAHHQVDRDFSNIFTTLLPGTIAALVPEEGKTALDGLRVRIGFGGKFKESLEELSGGQRSLVALSLVLAMLKFKPAPLYILDEVDSALDLSHTQNIGAMIKKHFTASQFIIVSLKEGMFNNANVIYRTRFVDGTSQVTRTENKS